MQKISYFIYKIIKIVDDLFVLLFNRSFLIFFSDFFNQDFYSYKEINSKKVKFFTPNQITKWRVKSLYSKEPETLEWIDKFSKINNEIIFWDVGANIGLYSIYAAQIHKNIKIYSFEPSTSNLRILSRNISINNLENKITINQFPLIDVKNSFLEMNEPEFIEGWAMNTYGEPVDYKGKHFKTNQKYRIFGTNIDYLIENNILKIPNYIKIDVDGAEDQIIKGGMKFLKHKNIKSIAIELNEEYLSQYENVFDLLHKSNFTFKQKKHAKIYDSDEKFSKLYNFVFEKNEN
jgi:FkbM family methyltransferase